MPSAPAFEGEHNGEICAELGMDPARVEALQADGALVGNNAAKVIANVLGEGSP